MRDGRSVLPVPAALGDPSYRNEWLSRGLNRTFLEDNYFASASVGGQIKVEISAAYQVKPVKWHNGSAWVAKPLKRHNGTSWVLT